MKKLWTKFKSWLIVKLGGHLEGPRTYKVEHVRPIGITVHACSVCATYTVYGDNRMIPPDSHIKNRLFEALGDELRKHKDLYSIDYSWDPITDEVVYKIVVKLIPELK